MHEKIIDADWISELLFQGNLLPKKGKLVQI